MKKALFRLSAILILAAMLAGMILPMTVVAEESEEVQTIQPPAIPERPVTDPEQSDAYEVILSPETDEANWWGKPYGAWMAGSNTLYYLSDMTYLVSSNTPNPGYPQGQPTTVNDAYGDPVGDAFVFGVADSEYAIEIENGIGMHPKNPGEQSSLGRIDSWTIYDISEYTETGAVDTFYALVGLTAVANSWGSRLNSAGVNVYIYGDKTGDGEHYELLAQSELVKGYEIGEFNVNVEGVELLLIDVILPEIATNHAYSAVGLGNACLFKADEDAVKPDYTGDCLCPDGYHVYGNNDWEVVSADYHRVTCDCGENTIYNVHVWNNGIVLEPEACLRPSVKVYTCLECGYQKTEELGEIQHGFGAWQKYSYSDHVRTCLCGDVVEYGLHHWDNGVITQEPTCAQTGIKTYTCSDCGEQKTEILAKKSHEWDNGVITQEPTCAQMGIKTYCCMGCSETRTEIVDMIAHEWDDGVFTIEPTCMQAGIKTYRCIDCREQRIEILAKVSHKWSVVWIIEDDEQHKHLCECGEVEYFDHAYTDENDRFCNDCGYQRTISDSGTTEEDDPDAPVTTGKDSLSLLEDELDEEMEEELRSIQSSCESVTGGSAISIALMGLSAGWFVMKKKKSDDED